MFLQVSVYPQGGCLVPGWGECLLPGVSAPRGCAWSGGVPGPGGLVSQDALSTGGVPGLGGVCSWGVCSQGCMPGPGGCAWSRGVCLVLGGLVSQDALRQTPLERWLLLWMVRILLECILVVLMLCRP